MPVRARLLARVLVVASGCWEWTGLVVDEGYGKVCYRGNRGHLAHRAFYQEFVGPVPAGLTLDHRCHTEDASCPGGPVCRHRRCVNPQHLEPMTTEQNSSLSVWARKTHCPHGHAYSPENTRVAAGRRFCIRCGRDRARAQYTRRLQAVSL